MGAAMAADWLAEGLRPGLRGSHRLWRRRGKAGHSALWAVDIEEGTRQQPGGRQWDVTIESASNARQDATEAVQDQREARREAREAEQAKIDRDKVLRAVERFPQGETKSVIKDVPTVKSARFQSVFAQLLAETEIELCQVVKNGRKEDAYKRGQNRSEPVGNPALF